MKHLLFFLLISQCAFAQNFSFTINTNSIGLIIDENDNVIGTGFVFLSPNQVITCAHVITGHPNVSFFPAERKEKIKLSVKSILYFEDIAVLYAIDTISHEPLAKGQPDSVMQGDEVIFIGFNSQQSKIGNITIKIHKGLIDSCGQVTENNKQVNFFEFKGEAIPGYSGGPVFNTDGQIIGLIKSKREVGETKNIIRAHFISPILKK